MRLEGKIAIVTGAGRGIGKAIALELAAEGATVAVNYSRSAEAAEEVVAEIVAKGGSAVAIKADVSVMAEVEAMVKSVKETFGKVDVLVNNAGITRDKLVMMMTEADWDMVLDTNLKSAFLCSKAVATLFLRQKSGVIVNVGSVIGRVGAGGQANYSASKAGLIGLTKSLAKELGSRNIRVNAVAPGFIETEMTSALKQEYRDAILKQVPLGSFGKGEDVAKAVAFLCSSDAAYIHGEVVTIDGGLFM